MTVDPLFMQLAEARKAQGRSLRDVGTATGRQTHSNIWGWESGTNAPTFANLREWASALGFDLVLERRPAVDDEH